MFGLFQRQYDFSDISVFEIEGDRPGQTILITGGMDGDELCGIEAAKKLDQMYQHKNFSGKLIIVPCVNQKGNEKMTSRNPLDNKFPKWVWPGKINGTYSEQLIYWLKKNFVDNCDVWLDLHGGAKDEKCNPFVWFWETDNRELNSKIDGMIKAFPSEIILNERAKGKYKPNDLAKKRKIYAVFESGELGKIENEKVANHVSWIEHVMKNIGILEMNNVKQITQLRRVIYHHQKEYFSSKNGIWKPNFQKKVKKNDLIGEVLDKNGKIRERVLAYSDGIFLWGKIEGFVKKGDSLFAYAY